MEYSRFEISCLIIEMWGYFVPVKFVGTIVNSRPFVLGLTGEE